MKNIEVCFNPCDMYYDVYIDGILLLTTSSPFMSDTDIYNMLCELYNDIVISNNLIYNDNDIDFDKLNESVGFEAKTGRYKNTFNETDVNDIIPNIMSHNKVETHSKTPIGQVETPNVGDLIYIETVKGILSTIIGGVCTVSMVHVDETEIVTDTLTHSYDFENEYDEDVEEDITESNILVEIEEFPGRYFSWSLLRQKQDELQELFGYTPARLIN